MEKRIGLIAIVVEKKEAVEKLNQVLHDYREHIVGRMGIPYQQRGISVISVVVDASTNIISSLSGKLGMIEGVSIKTVYSKLPKGDETNENHE
ncbi:TM1266 family iron-only hydrogenase system putative regulator [Acetobacterium sp. K1/6]|uniref:TM1266 family iron-only hydrogenase system putative regulator n=1 Tax=Acetobacterium sp. K1/6 TaxID=3055467 RepID=UPI002ACAAA19|nr:TM1266 family iron-only hydrogenase system putative regulator [Acetobacterium sp. K1/6]MDZ5725349.1 TM1266 family iron-only hydrogenase system putative regulator [Acetobacterium sp. K1/6]